ncbi:unnamed protein product [Callosobruchus maculatus]|uniref:Fatty acid desaturase domain-containing protein n=1 Tax=Callosobruchus maculatus TaxID=64391 RepID=A0A653C288_CALMS|nr:unnamed protein product [Callosobruchus maculatus]
MSETMEQRKTETGEEQKKLSYSRETNWLKVLFQIQVTLSALCAIHFLLYESYWSTILFSVAAGAHRLWAHRSYTANGILKTFLLFCQTLSGTGSLYDWVQWHRLHHKHFGTDLDPFNPTKGWFYSHIQSVALNLSPAQEEALKEIDMSDLEKDKMIMFQKRWYIPLYVIFVLLLPINAPAEYWGEQLHASMFLVFWLRYTLNLHLSWLIHSATRIWQLKPGEKYKVYRYVVLVSLMALLCLGWAYIPTNWDHITITEITKVICVYGMSIGNLIQVFFIMKDGKGLRNVLDRLQSDLFQPTSFDQWEIAEIAKSSGRRIRRTFVVLNGAGCVVLPVPVLFGQERVISLSFPTSLFCVFQLACLTFYAFIMVLIVTLNCNLLLEAGIQIDILKDRIAHSRGMDYAILECIQHSKEVISLVDQIKRIQEFPLLFYFGVQVFILCTAIFSLTDQMSPDEMSFMIMYVTSVTSMVFVMCWYGNEMTYKSTSLTQTIFHCDWIGSDVKSQKIIMFFMYISNTPLKISMAGGLCNLSIPLFISIIRTAYSYFTLLTNFR